MGAPHLFPGELHVWHWVLLSSSSKWARALGNYEVSQLEKLHKPGRWDAPIHGGAAGGPQVPWFPSGSSKSILLSRSPYFK